MRAKPKLLAEHTRTEALATRVDHIHCAEIHLSTENFRSYRDEPLCAEVRGRAPGPPHVLVQEGPQHLRSYQPQLSACLAGDP